jgi:type IV fimbrial biogenesis protein FimT
MPNNQGFTLIEMMITLAIAAILVTIGVPSFFDMIQRNTVSSASNELVSALLYARSEAVRQEVNVVFTPGENSWVVQVDDGDDATDDATLLEYVIENPKLSLITNGATITYNSRGRGTLSEGNSYGITFDDTLEARICLTLAGRPYIKKADDGACP